MASHGAPPAIDLDDAEKCDKFADRRPTVNSAFSAGLSISTPFFLRGRTDAEIDPPWAAILLAGCVIKAGTFLGSGIYAWSFFTEGYRYQDPLGLVAERPPHLRRAALGGNGGYGTRWPYGGPS